MDDFLRFLTGDDRQRLMAGAQRREVGDGEVILAEGDKHHAIFVFEEGAGRVVRSHEGFDIEIASLSPGELFGEMSFIEEFGASASVLADGKGRVLVFDGAHVQALIDDDPGFAGRFYRSVAEILSRRLRSVVAQGISEYGWGGRAVGEATEVEGEGEGEEGDGSGWGGGSPLRDFAAED